MSNTSGKWERNFTHGDKSLARLAYQGCSGGHKPNGLAALREVSHMEFSGDLTFLEYGSLYST